MFKNIYSLILFTILVACNPAHHNRISSTDDGLIEIAFLQMNDVYEIGGVSGGRQGNLARVSYLYDQIKEEYPCHYMVLAGDFLNPSLINTLEYEGERIQGKQMIETLNAMDLDLVTLGNHEFDLDIDDLQKRIDESNFNWICTNLQQICGNTTYPFYKTVAGKKQFFPETMQISFEDKDGTTAQIGIFSATLASNPTDYYQYFDADSCIDNAIRSLKSSSDILIGLTHLDAHDDTLIARNKLDINLILGGHDHDNMIYRIGDVTVAKADANAKTVYLHILKFDKNSGELEIESELIPIDESVPSKASVQQVIDKWDDILNKELSSVIPHPEQVIYHTTIPLDGRESSIRHRQTSLGEIVTSAFHYVSKENAVAAIINSGSIRIDDQLTGDITGVDIFRVLPFGGKVVEANLKGSLIKGILRYSINHPGNGAFLQLYNITQKDKTWYIDGKPINDNDFYMIAMNDFLLKGYDIPFLTLENNGVESVYEPKEADDIRNDIRIVIIEYLKQL
jgi:5'-nucleotidase/UDP-sugar diphosphatase